MTTSHPGTAKLSACGVYRHELTRMLDARNPRVLVVCGLNPSTATADVDDATIRKELKYAQRWGCGLLVKVNAYDFRATQPTELLRAAKRGAVISSADNDADIRDAVARAQARGSVILAAWGRNIRPDRQAEVARLLGRRAVCLGTNQDGSPVHPLYQKDDATPIGWRLPDVS